VKSELIIEVLDVVDFAADLKLLQGGNRATCDGVRAFGTLYDEHSADQKSRERIQEYVESLEYRIRALEHVLNQFDREYVRHEAWLAKEHRQSIEEQRSFYPRMPHMDYTETALGSIVDSYSFHLNSAFDYLAHMLSYASGSREHGKSHDWSSLAKSVGNNHSISRQAPLGSAIARVDSTFVKRIEEYRNRVIHKQKDDLGLHMLFDDDRAFYILLTASEFLRRTFRKCLVVEGPYSVRYFLRWLHARSLLEIGNLLRVAGKETLTKSVFMTNIRKPKADRTWSLVIADGPFVKPVSDHMWRHYEKAKREFAQVVSMESVLGE
jgi:hypothetical protein